MLFEQIRGKQRCTARQSKQKALYKNKNTLMKREYIGIYTYIYVYAYLHMHVYMIIYFGFVFFFVSHAYIHIYCSKYDYYLMYVCIVWIAIYEISLLILCTCLFFKATRNTTHTRTTYPLA